MIIIIISLYKAHLHRDQGVEEDTDEGHRKDLSLFWKRGMEKREREERRWARPVTFKRW